MIGTEHSDGACDASSVGIAFGGRDCVLFARNRSEAARYSALLEEMGIEVVLGDDSPAAGLGIPIFVTADERDRAGEILSTFHSECAWDGDDEEEDDFDDEDEEDDDEEFFPDDVDDDDFDDDDDDEDEEEDLD